MRSAFAGAARWLVLAVVVGMIASGAVRLGDYLELCSMLRGKSLLERGYAAANQRTNFLNAAGRPRLRRVLREARERGAMASSSLARLWVWVNESARALPPDASIFIAVPGSALYYYATFFWFPRVVAVSRPAEVVKDDETLVRGLERIGRDPDAVRRLGHTHLVTASGRGLRVEDLRSSHGASAP